MQVPEIYHAFGQYNTWMNERLLEACAKLTNEKRKKPMGAPFHSIDGVWNHLLLTDRGWLCRFKGEKFPYPALDLILYEDFEEFRQERAKTDAEIEAFVRTLTAERLGQPFTVIPVSNPTPRTIPYFVAVTHLFNHQTHHRGQITALLEQLGGDCGVTDFAAMPAFLLPNP